MNSFRKAKPQSLSNFFVCLSRYSIATVLSLQKTDSNRACLWANSLSEELGMKPMKPTNQRQSGAGFMRMSLLEQNDCTLCGSDRTIWSKGNRRIHLYGFPSLDPWVLQAKLPQDMLVDIVTVPRRYRIQNCYPYYLECRHMYHQSGNSVILITN